ncbi:MAG TPA: N-acetyltransferase [Methanoregula sp.]|nr:N-acetyltransferase [Methanoregula sp.]
MRSPRETGSGALRGRRNNLPHELSLRLCAASPKAYPDTSPLAMSITIRTYRDEDFKAVAALEESGLHEPYRSAVFVRQMGEVCKETFFVAVTDGDEPVGYTVGAAVQHNISEAWILRMGVRDDQRRKGIGSALLKSVTGALQARHARTIRLSVSPENLPAIRLYEGQGFVQEKIIPAYFGEGEDRILMKKTRT